MFKIQETDNYYIILSENGEHQSNKEIAQKVAMRIDEVETIMKKFEGTLTHNWVVFDYPEDAKDFVRYVERYKRVG